MPSKEYNTVKMVGVLPAAGADAIPVGKIPDGAGQVIEFDKAENATVVVYEVGAVVVLYLSHLLYSIYNFSGGVDSGRVFVTNAADVTQYVFTDTTLANNSGYIVPVPFLPPLEIPAGWKIKVHSRVAGLEVWTCIHGYEV